MNVTGAVRSLAGYRPTKKHLLIAFALASEWALAFAFAKRLANAVADLDADAFEQINRLRERTSMLEQGQVRSGLVGHSHPWSAGVEGARVGSIVPD